MSSAAAVPPSESMGPILDEAFEGLFEDAGLSDMAREVGIGGGGPAFRSLDGAFSSDMGVVESSSVGGCGDSASVGGAMGACSTADSSASPPRVHMPSCATVGPSVPAGLEGTLAAAGDGPASKKKRMQRAHGGKQGDKGLRHFSMKVCEKVEQKGRTTYNEVADELVAEFAVAGPDLVSAQDQAYDEKNIRRRVYDALNVLMAMEIITKEKKSILWRGLPTNTEQEGARLQMDLNSRAERMERKRSHLSELITQQVSFKQLIARNRSPQGNASAPADTRIKLPFIVVNTKRETVIDCEMAEDQQEIFFNFSAPFEIHDDSETLKRMNMQRCTHEQLGAFVPEAIAPFAADVLATHGGSGNGGGPGAPFGAAPAYR